MRGMGFRGGSLRANGKLVAWSAGFVLSQANIVRLLGPVAPKVLKTQTAPSARVYAAVLDGMDSAEIGRYRSHFYLDFVHPGIYATALRAGVRRLDELSPLPPATKRALLAAPVVSAAGDYIENVAGLYLLDHRDRITDGAIRATTAISTTKWVLALGSLAYLARGFARAWGRADR
ncbi:hypothetical protein [Rhodococcus xishaensis]|uniref:Uncharacterized protein n=1 Tax=Rhodococcus xishaensis TaxID=2487364 RepID=A0A3S3CTC1_9NOCA|nr:hypothetical protein [Rhodococcus xishaensis]RVW05155.1 hypothetical protein EGT50_00495 [Rhodococcus xishaensis]